VRTLFFNPPADTAWTVDLGLSTAFFGPNRHPPTVSIRNPNFNPTQAATGTNLATAPVTPKDLNESYLNLALGQEYYLWGSAYCPTGCTGPNWRIGWDVGGRYGTGHLALQPNVFFIPPRTASVGGFFVSLHSDLEIPTGCCIFFIGFRSEYGWAFSDILGAGNDGDLQTVNLLVNFGLRF
jgi:hypothetical protein